MGATSRKKIGFISYDGDTIESVDTTQEIAKGEELGMGNTIPMSEAQADLIETINSLTEIIVDSSFQTYSEESRVKFVSKLKKWVALNAELTIKTILIVG